DSPRGPALRRADRARPHRRPRRAAPDARSCRALHAEKEDAEGAAASLHAVDLDVALVLAHDLGADEEPEARPASGLFRREERLEDPLADRGRDAAAGICDGDLDLAVAGRPARDHVDAS